MIRSKQKSVGRRQDGKSPSLSNGLSRNSNKITRSFDEPEDLQSEPSQSVDVSDEMQDLDLHLDLDDLEDYSGASEDWDSESDKSDEELHNLEYNTNQNYPQFNDANGATRQSGQENNGALVPFDDDGVDVDSEEERDIMKEIKNEITNKLRGEMKSELDMYKARVEALENGEIHTTTAGASNRNKEEDVEDMEPKLKEAILKMRKLDRILSKKIAREKQVKRDRILLERRIKQELKELKTEGSKQNREETANTAKYLALTLPPRHNEGVEIPKNLTEPVFTTQLNEQDYPGVHRRNDNDNSSTSDMKGNARTQSTQDTNSEFGSETSSVLGSNKSGKKRKKKKDFIKRNKELAGEAENPVPMTDEEKKRLDNLLDDIDTLPEILDENIDPTSSSDNLLNPFQITIKPGEGFLPEANEQRSLSHIDNRLRQLLPPEEYESVASSSLSFTAQHKLFTPVGFRSGLDCERFGERALLETKEQRELQARLQQVEEELAKLHSSHELELPETPSQLGEDQLKDLLDQCVRSLSRNTYDDSESGAGTPSEVTPRSPNSARESLMENPPKLSKATLQKLLADAYCPASRLSTLREEEEDDIEGDSDTEPIDAETWKLIAQERLEGEDDEEYHSHMNTVRSSVPSFYFSEQNSRNSSNSSCKMTTSQDYSLSRSESRESRTPFLPEINRSGSLVATQEWNNSRPSSIQSNRSSVITVRNSLNDTSNMNVQDSMEVLSITGDTPVPMPPSGEKRSNSSYSNKSSRLMTPVNKSLS